MTDEIMVVAAAVNRGGLIFSRPRPARHHDILHMMDMEGLPIPISGQQGFLLSDGTFTDRVHAMSIARRSGQVPRSGGTLHSSELFSEDLW